MKNVTLTKALALEMYNGDNSELKKFALENYPEFGMKITDRVKTMQDVYDILGVCEPKSSIPQVKAFEDLVLLYKVLNEGWSPDWNNSNEAKYYPYFDMRGDLVFNYWDYDYSNAYVPSLLCARTSELAEYAGKQFIEVHRKYMK